MTKLLTSCRYFIHMFQIRFDDCSTWLLQRINLIVPDSIVLLVFFNFVIIKYEEECEFGWKENTIKHFFTVFVISFLLFLFIIPFCLNATYKYVLNYYSCTLDIFPIEMFSLFCKWLNLFIYYADASELIYIELFRAKPGI